MKKALLFLVAILVFFSAHAQKQRQKFQTTGFHFAGGINLGLSLPSFFGDIPDPWGIGIELQPEYLLTKRFGLYGSTGYTNFFNKIYSSETSSFKTHNVGFIPVLVGAKVYFTPGFSIGCKAGVAFVNSEKDIKFLNAERKEKTAFDIQPQVAFTKNKFQGNFGVNVFSDDDVHLSFGILYNFK